MLRFFGFIFITLLAAFFLDNLLHALSLFLGLMAVIPILLYKEYTPLKASLWGFLFGLMMDGTHIRFPFGFNAFFALGIVFFIHSIRLYLPPDRQERWLLLINFFTVLYYILLSTIFGIVYLGNFLFSILASVIYNTLIWRYYYRKFPESFRIIR